MIDQNKLEEMMKISGANDLNEETVKSIMNNLNEKDKKKVNDVLNDKQKLEKILSDSSIQSIIKKFGNKNG